ncbi:ROK family protein [Calycomorphotria hydatis]|uniref:Glucokinase n=1 Tax=Calycomorphotria hydatis TaxID=2528027 RepID=A0A517T6B9_9PLAN|nr:ROK family protein [Calycomorphotria hydatis]QDT63926.1 Glucokinase [Calycomorphotria hydatis]
MDDSSPIRVGFDLGGTKMYALVFDEEYNIIGKARKKTKGHQGAKNGIERVFETIDEALDDAKCSAKQLVGIGIGCPGPLNWKKGVIINTPNLGWKNVRVKALLEDQFKCPATVLNDVDAGVYGEYRFGAAKGAHCVLGVFPGTGIGGGCVYEGNILRGRTMTCMEVGHIPMLPGGPRSGIGHRGSLEAIASRLAIAGAASQAAYRGQAPKLLEEAGTDLSNIRSGMIRDAIKNGDEVIEEIIEDAAEHIGTAIGGVVSLLLPEIIILGGGLVEAMPELIVKEVTKAAREHVMPAYRDEFKIVAASLGDNATALGAAAWMEATTVGNQADSKGDETSSADAAEV